MPSVFLSHKKLDREWTLHLREQLQAAGLDVFVDETMRDASDWRTRFAAELERRDWLVIVASPEAVVSPEVRHEYAVFTQDSAKLDRVRIVQRYATPLPPDWSVPQAFDCAAEASYANNLPKLIATLLGAAEREPTGLPQPLCNPHWQEGGRLPVVLRQELLGLLGACCDSIGLLALRGVLGDQVLVEDPVTGEEWHEPWHDSELRASAALVLWTGRDPDHRLRAEQLVERMLKKWPAERLQSGWQPLLQQLRVHAAPSIAETLQPYFDFVRQEQEHEAVAPLRDAGGACGAGGLRDLDEVYVELSVETQVTTPALMPSEQVGRLLDRIEAEPLFGVSAAETIWVPSDGVCFVEQLQREAQKRGFVLRCVELEGVFGNGIQLYRSTAITFEPGSAHRSDDQAIAAAGQSGRLCVAFVLAGYLGTEQQRRLRQCLDEARRQHADARILRIETSSALDFEQFLRLKHELHPWLSFRVVIKGDPGSGKTTMLRHAARALAQQAQQIPVFVSLRSLATHRRTLAEDLTKRCENLCDIAPVLDRLASGGRDVVLLCDGLDEVTMRDDRVWIRDSLRKLARDYPEARIVVTTRRIPYEPLERGSGVSSVYRELELKPLQPDRQLVLLTRWFASAPGADAVTASQMAEQCLQQLDAPSAQSLARLRGVPLLLTFFAMAYERLETLPPNRAELYREVLDCMFVGWHRAEPQPMEPYLAARAVSGWLALAATDAEQAHTDDGDPGVRFEQLQTWLLVPPEHLDHYFQHVGTALSTLWQQYHAEQGPGTRQFLQVLCQRTGVLVGRDLPGHTWRFWHRTLREALVAELLVAVAADESGRALVWSLAEQLMGREGSWAEPFALFVGAAGLDDRDAWLLELSQRHRGLALRALGSLSSLRADTVQSVLLQGIAQGVDDRDGMMAEIDRLPELVGVVAAVGVLAALAPNFDDCELLWHVDQTLAVCLQQEPGLARDVAGVRTKALFANPSFGSPIVAGALTISGTDRSFWVEVPAGTFAMGSPVEELERGGDEGPVHLVTISHPFVLAATTVSNEQFQRFRPGHEFAPAQAHHPATKVSFFEAAMFCRWLGGDARLPSEAEWEYACRAGTTTPFSFGANVTPAQVNYDGNYPYADGAKGEDRSATVAVGSLPPNAWGLFEMHGNVWEWCQDRGIADYEKAPRDGTAWESGGSGSRVLRGGSWFDFARRCRSAFRSAGLPGLRFDLVGFRPASSSPAAFTTSPPLSPPA